MKRKKIDWSKVPWTDFAEAVVPDVDGVNVTDRLNGAKARYWRNSRYQVAMREYPVSGPEGSKLVHLSFHVLDRQPHHDWRDMQRIKNELVGPEVEAVELFPAESRLMDTSNEYHLWCFIGAGRLPFGIDGERAVGYGNWRNSRQREWAPGERPPDAIGPERYEQHYRDAVDKLRETK